jgi:hypothetical protein
MRLRRDPAGRQVLNGTDELGRPRDTADRLGGDDHRRTASESVLNSAFQNWLPMLDVPVRSVNGRQMARPRSFSTENAVLAAAAVFWSKGYRDTAMQRG